MDVGQRRWVMATIVLAVTLLFSGAVATASPAAAPAQQSQPETDNTVTRVEVSENGTARWTIQIRTRLDSDAQVAEYTAFQSRFRNDTDQYLDPFRTRMRGLVSNAADATGRDMRATNFRASTRIQEVPRRWGIVTYEFTWTNVTARRDGQLVLGDIFQGGFFIAADDSLQVVAPVGHEITRVDPEPASREGRVVTWVGREDFPDRRPRVVFTPTATTDTTETTDTATSDSGGEPVSPGTSGPLGGFLPAVLGAAGVVVGLVAFVALRRGGDEGDGTVSAENDHDPAAASDGATATPDSVATGVDGDDAAEPVMTEEELVVELLADSGGRVRQTVIAEELDWSPSKTSRVVGRLAEDGTVEKLRVGRENLVELVDEE